MSAIWTNITNKCMFEFQILIWIYNKLNEVMVFYSPVKSISFISRQSVLVWQRKPEYLLKTKTLHKQTDNSVIIFARVGFKSRKWDMLWFVSKHFRPLGTAANPLLGWYHKNYPIFKLRTDEINNCDQASWYLNTSKFKELLY